MRWGNKAFDPVEGPALIEFVANCRALCDVPVDAAGALKLSAVDKLLRDSVDFARVSSMLEALTDVERAKFGDVLTQSWVSDARGAAIARNASLDSVPGLTVKEATDKSLAATKVALAQRADAHVADAALGNSQYARHFEEDYDWLVKTFEWRSHLERIDPPVGTPLEAGNPSWYRSRETGLTYQYDNGADALSNDTRVDHVLNHTRRRSRNNDHGVFTTDSPFATVDEAYRSGGFNQDVQLRDPITDPDGVGFTIPGNSPDIDAKFEPVFCVRLGGQVDNVITAFPKQC